MLNFIQHYAVNRIGLMRKQFVKTLNLQGLYLL